MDIAILGIRLFLAAIFGLAAVGKFLDLDGSEKAVADFGVPKSVSKPVSILLPICESLIAIALLFIEWSWVGAIAGTTLLSVFVAGMLVQMAKGNAPDCHCFGQIHSEPVSVKSVIRNIAFVAAGVALIIAGRENQGIDIFKSDFQNLGQNDLMQLFIGIAIILLLIAVVYFLKKISEQQVTILRRIDILEMISTGENDIKRENIGHPDDGLPIGAPAPDFELPDVNGKIVEFNHLLAKSKPLIFLFVSPNCNPCNALLPDIESWKEEFDGKLEFVFVSSGDRKDNSDKFGDIANSILVQKEREIAELFGALWTPTALLINSDGTVGSHTAAGDEAIRALVEQLRSQIAHKDTYYIPNGRDALRKSKIGETIPKFEIEDLNGKNIRTENLLGKKTLIAFWSETCPHCVSMLDDLREWERDKGLDEPNLLMFSSGDPENHKNFGLSSPIILDEKNSLAIEFGMSGTPSAVLINEVGEFISETAIGAPQIWALIGKRNGNYHIDQHTHRH